MLLVTPALISASRKPSPPTLSRMPISKGEGIRIMPSCWMPLRRQPACGTGLVAGWQAADDGLYLRPALQFYSATIWRAPSQTTEPYADWQGLALESEFLPDSPNHPQWPQPDCVHVRARRRQPDGISVYRPIIASALHQGALLFVPASSLPPLFQQPALFSVTKGQKITCVLQAPWLTATLFSLWLDGHCRAPNHGNIMRIVINQ